MLARIMSGMFLTVMPGTLMKNGWHTHGQECRPGAADVARGTGEDSGALVDGYEDLGRSM
jgi:hypothetical protein